LLAAVCLVGLACGSKPKAPTKAPVKVVSTLSAEAYSHYLRGRLASIDGNLELAIVELRAATRAAPQEATIAIALADALYESGDSKAALRVSTQSTKKWPKSFPVWVQAGDLQRGLAAHAKAEAHYRRAIRNGARSEAVHLAYAAELKVLGKTAEEEAQYRKLLTKTSGSAEVHYQLALLLHRGGKQRLATKHARKASVLSPYDIRIWALLSTSLSAEGQGEAASNALRQPFDRSGGNTYVGDQLLLELLDLGNQEAAMNLVSILDRDDLPIDTRIGMGHMLLRLGEFEAALATAAALDKELATSAAIAELRFRALRALHRDDDAQHQLLAISERQKGYALTRAMLADLLAERGELAKAKKVVEEALKLHDDNADLVLAQASVAEKSGDIQAARSFLQAAMKRHPNAQRPRFALAELESRAGNLDTSIALISALIKRNPRDSAALNYVGYNLIDVEGGRERATSLLLRAVELSPDSAFILDSYGWLLLKSGDLRQAAVYLERASRLSRTEPELLWHLAELRWQQKKPSEALRLLARAESLALDRTLRTKIQRRRQILGAKP
jgi:tetratricopeptide (TPR) repeat protein